jgi:hypothetical protein
VHCFLPQACDVVANQLELLLWLWLGGLVSGAWLQGLYFYFIFLVTGHTFTACENFQTNHLINVRG